MKKVLLHIILFFLSTSHFLGQDTLVLYFEPGKGATIEHSFKVVDFRKTLDDNLVDSIHVHSYCDSTGNDSINARLSFRRAFQVHYAFTSFQNKSILGHTIYYDSSIAHEWKVTNRTPYKSTMQRQFYHTKKPPRKMFHKSCGFSTWRTSKGRTIRSQASEDFCQFAQYVEPLYSDELWKDRKVELIVFSSPKPEFTQDTLVFEVPSGQSYLNKEDLDSLHNYVREIKRLNITEVKAYSYVDKQERNGEYERSSEDLYIMRLKNATSFFEPDGTDHVIKVESIPYYEIEHQDQSKVEVIITRRLTMKF